MKNFIRITIAFIILIIAIAVIYIIMSHRPVPKNIQYGMSFNTLYAGELGLDWKKTYEAILTDLGVKHLRLASHWNLVEKENNNWNFQELDYQVRRAQEEDADIIFGVGRRLPRWPECHVPDWAKDLSWEDQKKEILEYIEITINRYKNYDNIINWQVENEPFLTVFANEHCGDLDVEFLEEEIELVKKLDNTRDILVTDSGNIGTWAGAYSRGDIFGTSVYVYLWNPDIGPFKTFLPASWYRFKSTLLESIYGKKEIILIELSLEPWLLNPIVEIPIELQLERMDINKFNEIIKYAENTRLDRQYLWGAEWWYYMKQQGYSDFWQRAKEIF